MIDYVYDFLSILAAKTKVSKIKSIILFGSVARGDYRKDSDIDLFIDINSKDKKEIDDYVKNALNEFEIKSERSWHLKGIKNAIQPIVDDLSNKKWDELRSEISSYGKVLFGNLIIPNKKNSNLVLIEYNISKLKQKDKMNIIREVYGYKNKKNGKVYEHKGIIDECNGEKVANGIILQAENYKKVLDFLRKNNIPIKIRKL